MSATPSSNVPNSDVGSHCRYAWKSHTLSWISLLSFFTAVVVFTMTVDSGSTTGVIVVVLSLISTLVCGITAVVVGLITLIRISKTNTVSGDKTEACTGLIIGLLPLLALCVAIPNFVKARTTPSRNACCNNLRQLDGAKEQWALENNITNMNIAPNWSDMVGMDKYMKVKPQCPAHGTYYLNNMNSKPTCSIGPPGHTL